MGLLDYFNKDESKGRKGRVKREPPVEEKETKNKGTTSRRRQIKEFFKTILMKYRDSEDESEEKLIKPAAVKPDVKEPKRGGRKKKEEKEEEELEEVNPEEYFSNTTTRKSRKRPENPVVEIQGKDVHSHSEREPEEKKLRKMSPAKATKPSRAKGGANTRDLIVKEAIDAGVKVILCKDLPEVEKSTFNFWAGKQMKTDSLQDRAVPVGADGCLEGMTFVITGELPSYSRETVADVIKRYGGRVTSAVSSKTTFLILGDSPGSSKITSAKKHNVSALDEDGFVGLVESFREDSGEDKNVKDLGSNQMDIDETNTKDAQDIKTEKAEGIATVGKKSATELVKAVEKIVIDKSIREEEMREAKQEPAESTKQGGKNQQQPEMVADSELWVDKYKPKTLKEVCGNKTAIDRVYNWLSSWNYTVPPEKRAVLISGSPGIGKTTAAWLVAKDLGMDVIEYNASDVRNKSSISNQLGVLTGNHTITEYFSGNIERKDTHEKEAIGKKVVVIMDEVDGMSSGDRGGTAELSKMIQKTKVPIICICNDRMDPKMRTLANYCEDIKFIKPQAASLRSRLMSICFREGLKADPNALDQLCASTRSDMRQMLNILSTWKLSNDTMTYDQGKQFSAVSKKEIKTGPFDVIGELLNAGAFQNINMSDKINLYFNDYMIIPLMLQENYLSNNSSLARSFAAEKNIPYDVANLEMLSRAADSISESDLIETSIHTSQNWSLMPSHSVLSCVRPAYFATGSRNAMYNFPAWLGKNSSRNKNLRLASELEGHLRSSVTADKLQVRQEYLGGLFLAVVWPLVQAGKHGDVKETIEHVIDIMDGYNLTRQDFDTITELLMVKSVVNIFYSAGNDKHDKEIKRRIDMVKALLSQYIKTGIETKVKNAFTRTFNTKSHRFTAEGGSAGSGGGEGGRAKKGGGMMMAKPDLEDVIDEEEEDDSTNGNGEDEPGTDTLISVKNKRKGSSTSTKSAAKSAAKPAAKPRKRAPAKK